MSSSVNVDYANGIVTEKNFPIQTARYVVLFGVLPITLFVLSVLWKFFTATNYIDKIATMPIYFTLGSPVVVYIIYNLLRMVTFHYAINDTGITVRQGIFFKQEINIPYREIQNASINQDKGLTPLDILNALLGCSSLVIEKNSGKQRLIPYPYLWEYIDDINFGGATLSGNEVRITGFANEDAEKLKNIILQNMI